MAGRPTCCCCNKEAKAIRLGAVCEVCTPPLLIPIDASGTAVPAPALMVEGAETRPPVAEPPVVQLAPISDVRPAPPARCPENEALELACVVPGLEVQELSWSRRRSTGAIGWLLRVCSGNASRESKSDPLRVSRGGDGAADDEVGEASPAPEGPLPRMGASVAELPPGGASAPGVGTVPAACAVNGAPATRPGTVRGGSSAEQPVGGSARPSAAELAHPSPQPHVKVELAGWKPGPACPTAGGGSGSRASGACCGSDGVDALSTPGGGTVEGLPSPANRVARSSGFGTSVPRKAFNCPRASQRGSMVRSLTNSSPDFL